MWKDPIVEEVRAERRRHAKEFDFDLVRIFESLKSRERQHPDRLVSRPPRRPAATKKSA